MIKTKSSLTKKKDKSVPKTMPMSEAAFQYLELLKLSDLWDGADG
jgi:hypothetical protein